MNARIAYTFVALTLFAQAAEPDRAASGSGAFTATEEVVGQQGPHLDSLRVAADLDGDGRQDLVFGTAVTGAPVEAPAVVLGALRWDAVASRHAFIAGVTALRGFREPRLIPYRRTDSKADGIAVVGRGQTGFKPGERYEGLPLRRVAGLPLFRLEHVLAIADLDNDGVLEAITASQFGLNRWRFDRTIPDLERNDPACRAPACEVVALGNFDGEPGPELLLRGPGLHLVDLPDLSPLWSSAESFDHVYVGNVDGDAALEIVVQRRDGIRTEFSVYDGNPLALLGSFVAQCPHACLVGESFVADSEGADGKVELHYGGLHLGLWRRALPEGTELPSVGPTPQAPSLVAVEDLDGNGRAEAISSADTVPLPEWWVHDAASLASPTRIALAVGELHSAVNWRRLSGREIVRPIDRFGFGTVLVGIDADDAVAWRFPAAGGGSPLLSGAVDLSLADVDGDGLQDLLALDGVDLLAFAGSDRRLLWRRAVGPANDPFARPLRVLGLNLDGQTRDEILLGYRSSVAAFDASTGGELWRLTGLPAPTRQFERIQIDHDPADELLLASDFAIAGIEVDLPSVAFRLDGGFTRASTVLHNGTQVELLAFGDSRADVWRLPDLVLQAQVPHSLGALTALAPVPGRADLLVGGTFDGRLVAVDRAGFRPASTTESFGSMIGRNGRLALRPATATGRYDIEAGSDLAFVTTTLDPGLVFRDSFEALP